MVRIDEVEDQSAALRLRCVRQITDADEETLQIVSSVLARVLPQTAIRRKRRGGEHAAREKGGAE
jgi:hypothetical protein